MTARIGLDGRALGNINRNRGIGRYTARLAEALAHSPGEYEFVLFGYGDGPVPGLVDGRALGSMEWRRIPSSGNVEFYGGPTDHLRFARDVKRSGVDLFHGIDHNMTPLLSCRSVVTVHDLIPLVLRGAYLGPRSRAWLCAHRIACARSDIVIAVSESTRDDLRRLWNMPPERIAVVDEGVSPGYRPAGEEAVRAVARKHGIERPYFLYLGGFDPRKNIFNMLLGYKRYRLGGGTCAMVICGETTGYEGEMEDTLAELGLSDEVLLPGFVDDGDLPTLYSGARALVFVSLYEGFGLPVLEAMACGAPVIGANTTSIPSVAGDSAILVDPLDPGAIAGAMARLESEPGTREELSSRGLARAARFTWESAAGRVKEIYAGVLGGAS